MNLYKRTQGIYLENNYLDSNINLTFKTQLSGGISRGKFSRQVFFGIENNQKLTWLSNLRAGTAVFSFTNQK